MTLDGVMRAAWPKAPCIIMNNVSPKKRQNIYVPSESNLAVQLRPRHWPSNFSDLQSGIASVQSLSASSLRSFSSLSSLKSFLRLVYYIRDETIADRREPVSV